MAEQQERYEVILGHAGFGVRDNLTGEFIADALDSPEEADREIEQALERDAQQGQRAERDRLLEEAFRERGFPLSPFECGPEAEEQIRRLMDEAAAALDTTTDGEVSDEAVVTRVADAYAVLYGMAEVSSDAH